MTNDAARDEDPAEVVKREAAAELATARWNNASTKVNLDHDYLVAKKVTSAEGLRQEGKLLLVPMKPVEDPKKIVSLQTISPDGTKLYLRDSRTKGTFTTIGMKYLLRDEDKNPIGGQRIFIAEGWATAWSISHVMKAPVAVAFSTSNLRHVVQFLIDKYVRPHGIELVVAADNDRWSGQAGVTVARKAIYPPFGRVAIPDFRPENLELAPGEEKGPTDFNDLFVLEGPDAVKYWLEPDHAREAAISVRGPEIEPPPEEEKELPPPPDVMPPWYEYAKFRCLGYDYGTFFFLPRTGGQIVEFTPGMPHSKLLELAPYEFWLENFPSKQSVDWMRALDELMQACYRVGVFQYSSRRGRGCWEDADGGIILHLGDRLLAPGAKSFVDPETYTCSRKLIYERKLMIDGPSAKRALTLQEGQDILNILFKDIFWLDEASGFLLAGWTVLAPVCGALPWRPHVWVTGGTGAGKTTLVKELVLPLLGGMAQYFEGGTSEAGIRQKLQADALPVIYDEAERVDARTDQRLQSILALARSASSTGAETVKGTTAGTAMAFQCRSMFCLASIGGAVRQEADKTRVSLLQLRSPHEIGSANRDAHWGRWYPKVKTLVTEEVGRELIARTLRWLRSGDLDKTLKVFRAQAGVVLGSARSGDQYGTLYAGAWTLMSDKVPEAGEARELLASSNLTHYIAEQAPEGVRVLDVILQAQERVDTKNGQRTLTVGQLIDAASGKVPAACTSEEADAKLMQLGLKVDTRRGRYVLLVANKSEWLARQLENTPYVDNVQAALRTLDGAEACDAVRFAGFRQRVTQVPLTAIETWGATPNGKHEAPES